YDDLLTVKTWLRELPTDHKIEFYHEVYNEKNKLLTSGKVVLYFLNAHTKSKTLMPDILKEKLKPYFHQSL
ncbi:hypothetical protein ABTA81_19465, partial [Acinetobacter baumannii]